MMLGFHAFARDLSWRAKVSICLEHFLSLTNLIIMLLSRLTGDKYHVRHSLFLPTRQFGD